MNLNIKKVSVPVLMFLMAQSGFGVSNANFGNANLALAQNNEIGQARAVRCLMEEAIKKDEANPDSDHAELKKLLVGSTTPQQIGAMLKEAYIEYLVPRSDPNDAVREALEDAFKDKTLDKDGIKNKIMEILVNGNLFSNEGGKYLWWTIDGYESDTPGDTTIKGKFNRVVEAMISSDDNGWKDMDEGGPEGATTNNKNLLIKAITDTLSETEEEKKPIASLSEDELKADEQEINEYKMKDRWDGLLENINILTKDGIDENREKIIGEIQGFLGEILVNKLINPKEGDIREDPLADFLEGRFMRKSGDYRGYSKLKTKIDKILDSSDRYDYKRFSIFETIYDAIYDDIEGLLRMKDAVFNVKVPDYYNYYKDDSTRDPMPIIVDLLDHLASTERKWEKIGVVGDSPLANLRDQLKRIVWIDDDDNDVAGAKESDNESYDYDSSDINGGDSDEEQAERAEEAVTEGLESADNLIDDPQP